MDSKVLNQKKNALLDQQDRMLKGKLEAKAAWTDADETQFENITNEITGIDKDIARVEAVRRGRQEVNTPSNSVVTPGENSGSTRKFQALGSTNDTFLTREITACDSEYAEGFWKSLKGGSAGFNAYVNSYGREKCYFGNASLGEGGTTADGSALVPISTDPSIPNLAMYEASARSLSRVITTEMDINVPYQSARSTAAVKAETNNSGSNSFSTSVPQFATTKLSAYQVGNQIQVSWELLQDSKALASFVAEELQRAISTEEEYLFVNGSGSSQAQGYLGNFTTATGASITAGAATLGINPIIDTMGSLLKNYYANASWLVARPEFNRLLKAQIAASQFQTFIQFDPSGQARLFGYPVAFSYQMPTYAASPAVEGAWLFGDFRAGAVIGDRGDSNIRIKVLDQVAAQAGATVILGYRRTDQRVVLQEACVELLTNG